MKTKLTTFDSFSYPGACMELLVKYGKEFPTKRMLWLPRFSTVSSLLSFRFYSILYHLIPAIFLDVVLMYQKSEIRLKEIYRKAFYQSILLDYFLSRTWKFHDVNMRTLYQDMDKKDHKDFPVQVLLDDYDEHARRFPGGLLKYFFKENDDDLKIARKRYKMFYVLHYLLLAVIYGSIAYTIYRLVC